MEPPSWGLVDTARFHPHRALHSSGRGAAVAGQSLKSALRQARKLVEFAEQTVRR